MAHFLDYMGAFSHEADLCMRELSTSLLDWAYTWYVNLRALNCCNVVVVEVLVDEYRIFLENLSFLSFSKLMKAPRRTNELV